MYNVVAVVRQGPRVSNPTSRINKFQPLNIIALLRPRTSTPNLYSAHISICILYNKICSVDFRTRIREFISQNLQCFFHGQVVHFEVGSLPETVVNSLSDQVRSLSFSDEVALIHT